MFVHWRYGGPFWVGDVCSLVLALLIGWRDGFSSFGDFWLLFDWLPNENGSHGAQELNGLL